MGGSDLGALLLLSKLAPCGTLETSHGKLSDEKFPRGEDRSLPLPSLSLTQCFSLCLKQLHKLWESGNIVNIHCCLSWPVEMPILTACVVGNLRKKENVQKNGEFVIIVFVCSTHTERPWCVPCWPNVGH